MQSLLEAICTSFLFKSLESLEYTEHFISLVNDSSIQLINSLRWYPGQVVSFEEDSFVSAVIIESKPKLSHRSKAALKNSETEVRLNV